MNQTENLEINKSVNMMKFIADKIIKPVGDQPRIKFFWYQSGGVGINEALFPWKHQEGVFNDPLWNPEFMS